MNDDVKRFDAVVSFEDGTWLIELADEPRVHTFGRTIAAARENLADAAALWYELEPCDVDAHVVEVRGLPDGAAALLAATLAARAELAAAQEAAHLTAAYSAGALVQVMSRRDAAELLQLSHQRVHQLAEAPPKVVLDPNRLPGAVARALKGASGQRRKLGGVRLEVGDD
jgi:predicted RNase H-like HicB family nuclease